MSVLGIAWVVWFALVVVVTVITIRAGQRQQQQLRSRLLPPVSLPGRSDPYAPRCPFCMQPTVNEKCDNLDCWFVGNIVPIPEYIQKRPVFHMDAAGTPEPMGSWRAWATSGAVNKNELISGAYIDLSMATPDVSGLTAEQLREMSVGEYALLRNQLMKEASEQYKRWRWAEDPREREFD